ncbi:MAG: hypothetical protein WCI97_09680 [Bacteroidota bacterium]
MRNRKILMLLGVTLLFTMNCFAQKDLPGMSLDVVTDYKPLLADAVKIDVSSKLLPADSSKIVPTYNLQPKLLNLPFVPADIRPVAMVKETPEATQNNYFKGGFGTQLSPFFSLNVNSGVSEKREAGLYAMHQGGSGALDFQKFSDNIIQANYKKFLKKSAFTIKADYASTSRYFYGYNHSDTLFDFVRKDLKQNFQNMGAAIDLSNTKPTKNNWNYDFTTDYYYYWNRTGANEWHIAPGLLLAKTVNKIHTGSLYIGADINQYNEDSVSSFNHIIHIKPMYTIKQDKWSLHVGFDVAPIDSMVYFLPDVEAHYNLIGEYVVPFAGVTGEINKNNFKTLSTENPFLNKNQPLAYSKTIDIHGGIKGSVGNHFSFLIRVADQLVDHLALYNPDSNDVTRYDVSFAEDANVFNVHGELGYKESERLNILLVGDYNTYTLDFSGVPYGLPTQKISLKAEYNIQNKILINASVYGANKTFYRLPSDTTDNTLKGHVDVNLGLIYNYKKNFGAFLQFSNITAAAYHRWFNYPNYGFGLMGGLIVKF